MSDRHKLTDAELVEALEKAPEGKGVYEAIHAEFQRRSAVAATSAANTAKVTVIVLGVAAAVQALSALAMVAIELCK